MTIEEKKALCAGCRNDFYNRPGHSSTGQCWSLQSAKVVERTRVGWWQAPPYVWDPVTTLQCHHCPGQIAWISSDDVRVIPKREDIGEPTEAR
jgi:hypothetical protein